VSDFNQILETYLKVNVHMILHELLFNVNFYEMCFKEM